MNRLTIIGNLTKDPELRSTTNGTQVCGFTVAVNRRSKKDGQQEADFFNISAWRELGENCHKYLAKGRKVMVSGPVSVRTYQRNDGSTGAVMEVVARDVEFLSPRGDADNQGQTENQSDADNQGQTETQNAQSEFTPVAMSDDDLPF